MRYRTLSLTFLLIFVLGMLWSQVRHSRVDTHLAANAAARDMADPQEILSQSSVPFPHHILLSEKGAPTGYILFSGDVAGDIKGYGGHIPMVIKLNPSGEIKEIRVLAHNETPSYVGDLNNFSRQFINKSATDPLEIRKDIDVISRATITSDAATRTIRKCLATFSENVLGQGHQAGSRAKTFPWTDILGSLIVFALCLAAILTADNRLRWLAMIAGFVYFGIMTATMLSIVQVANIGLLNIPDFITNPLWWLILVFAFMTALVIGRAWCATACPFVLPLEILYKLGRRSERPRPPDERIDRLTRYLKYLFLGLILAMTFILNDSSPANVEPFVTMFRGHATKLAWAFLALSLIGSIFYFRFWCVYLCPIGALTGLISRFSLFKIKLKATCATCDKCSNICPTQAISMNKAGQPIVDAAECILCGKCIKGCPEGKLSLRSSREEK